MTENPDQMQREWRAWREFCWELEAQVPDADLNSDAWSPVMKAAERWGEELVALRLEQTSETRRTARAEKLSRYEGVRTVEPETS